jgi:uncharacterized surface protein with fasciclin (FAS1) repeats
MSYIGPNHEMYDMRQYYNIGIDLRASKQSASLEPDNTLNGVIQNKAEFSKFGKIITTAGLEGILSSSQANFTIFVPTDESLKDYPLEFFTQMDRGTAYRILMFSMMERVIDKELLQSSRTSYFPTRDRSHNLYVDNTAETILENRFKIIHWNHKVDNGMIHVVDGLLYFPDIPN